MEEKSTLMHKILLGRSIATPIGFKPAHIEDSSETLIIFTVFPQRTHTDLKNCSHCTWVNVECWVTLGIFRKCVICVYLYIYISVSEIGIYLKQIHSKYTYFNIMWSCTFPLCLRISYSVFPSNIYLRNKNPIWLFFWRQVC